MDIEAAYERFMQAYDYLTDSKIITKQLELVATLGYSEAAISSALKNKDRRFNPKFLKRFAHAYSDYINEEWILEGKGRMENVSRTMRPHYEATAAAGFMDGYSDGSASVQFRQMVVGLKDYDFTVRVMGDSMFPSIEEGDVLMCHKVNDRLNPPIGKICVLDTKEGMVVKEIVGADEEFVFVHSLNPEYRDYQIEHTSILNIARVVASIREY